jgi:hypothetical protein
VIVAVAAVIALIQIVLDCHQALVDFAAMFISPKGFEHVTKFLKIVKINQLLTSHTKPD